MPDTAELAAAAMADEGDELTGQLAEALSIRRREDSPGAAQAAPAPRQTQVPDFAVKVALAALRAAADAEYVRQHGGDDLETGHTRDPEGDEAAHG